MRRLIEGPLFLPAVFVLLLLGLVGAVLPVIPGFPFFIAALALLSKRFVWAKRMLDRLSKRGAHEGKPGDLKDHSQPHIR